MMPKAAIMINIPTSPHTTFFLPSPLFASEVSELMNCTTPKRNTSRATAKASRMIGLRTYWLTALRNGMMVISDAIAD